MYHKSASLQPAFCSGQQLFGRTRLSPAEALGCPPKTLVTKEGVVEMGLVAGYPALGHASIGILGGSA